MCLLNVLIKKMKNQYQSIWFFVYTTEEEIEDGRCYDGEEEESVEWRSREVVQETKDAYRKRQATAEKVRIKFCALHSL